MRQVALWMETWTNGQEKLTIPMPPIGVPVPVKANQNQAPNSQQGPAPANTFVPDASKSAMIDLSAFDSN